MVTASPAVALGSNRRIIGRQRGVYSRRADPGRRHPKGSAVKIDSLFLDRALYADCFYFSKARRVADTVANVDFLTQGGACSPNWIGGNDLVMEQVRRGEPRWQR